MSTYLEDLDVIKKAYVDAIHFTDDTHDTRIDGGVTPDTELSDEILPQIEDTCADAYFFALSQFNGLELNEFDLKVFGHDLWLTQNGHGSGFWDDYWSEDFGNIMTAYADNVGCYYPYEIDGKMYMDGKGLV